MTPATLARRAPRVKHRPPLRVELRLAEEELDLQSWVVAYVNAIVQTEKLDKLLQDAA